MVELLVTSIYFFAGTIILQCLVRETSKEKRLLVSALSFPFNISITTFFVLITSYFFTVNVYIIAIFELSKVILCYKHFSKINWKFSSISTLIFSLILLLFSFFENWLTNDSVIFSLFAKTLHLQTAFTFPQVGIVSYGVFLPLQLLIYETLIQSGWVYSCMVTGFLVSLCILIIFHVATYLDTSCKSFILIGSLVITAPIFFISFKYLHNHALQSFLFFATFTLILHYERILTGDLIFQVVACVFILALTLNRMESPIFVAILIFFMVSTLDVSKGALKHIFTISILTGLMWWTYVLFKSFEYSDVIIKPWSGMVAVALLLGSVGVLQIQPLLNKYCRQEILALATLTGLILFAVSSREHFFISFYSLIMNMFWTGGWGSFWWITISTVCLFQYFVFTKKIPQIKNNIWIIFIFLILGVILFLSWFRVPYRLGYGDSGNRMLFLAIPFACCYCLACLHYIGKKIFPE